jgi:hypothetical protein
MFKEKSGCAWGKCDSCGVVPLLHKLYKGELLEREAEIEVAKNRVFGR